MQSANRESNVTVQNAKTHSSGVYLINMTKLSSVFVQLMTLRRHHSRPDPDFFPFSPGPGLLY